MKCSSCGAPLSTERVRVRPQIALVVIAAGTFLSYVYVGGLLHDLIEGMQRSRLPYWHAVPPLLVLLAGMFALVRPFARQVCTACDQGVPVWLRVVAAKRPPGSAARRQALRALGAGGATLAAGAAGLGVAIGRNRGWIQVVDEIFNAKVESTAPAEREEWRGSRIRNYRRLGRTNFMVSDISARLRTIPGHRGGAPRPGSGRELFRHGAGLCGERLGAAARQGDARGAARQDLPGDEVLRRRRAPSQRYAGSEDHRAVEGSLQRLQTDYVDLIHVHSCDRVERLLAPNIHEAFDRLKEQGKARFLGVSTHTPNLEEVAHAAIDSERFDVMMLAYHFGLWPSLRPHSRESACGGCRHRRHEDPEGGQARESGRVPATRRVRTRKRLSAGSSRIPPSRASSSPSPN